MKRKIIVFLIMMLLIITTLSLTTTNVIAEDPNAEPEYLNYGWLINNNGTYFEITDSQYLNITLTSSEKIHIHLKSIPKVIDYQIESNCSADSTIITISGFETNKTYYRYEDNNYIEEFVIDGTGSYSYNQDITTDHNVMIQEAMSTIILGGGPSPHPDIDWDGDLNYTLTADIIDESIKITKSDIILNGNGHKLIVTNPTSKYTLPGVIISYVTTYYDVNHVTVKNLEITGFSYGVKLTRSDGNVVEYCNIHDNSYGTETIWSRYFNVQNCDIHDNTIGMEFIGSNFCIIIHTNIFDNRAGGIYGFRSHAMSIENCLISNNDGSPTSPTGFGIYYNWCGLNNILRNTIINHDLWGIQGIWFTGHTQGSNANIFDNVIKNNYYGLHLGKPYGTGNWNIITFNTIEDNHVGIWCRESRNVIHHNNIKYNTYQYQELLSSPPTNIWDVNDEGNYWSDYEGADTGIGKDYIGDDLLNHPDEFEPCADPVNGYEELDAFPFLHTIRRVQVGDIWPSSYIGHGVVMRFFEVTQEGKVNLDLIAGTPPPNRQLIPEDTIYNISTNAVYSGSINISIPYDESDVPTQEEDLTLQYYDGILEEWVEITTLVDNVNNRIYGETSHLSLFAIMITLNEPPIADAGGPYQVNEGVAITLDASCSFDPNGDPLTYEWDLDNDGQYNDATGVTTPFIKYDDGIYIIGLKVTDTNLESDTDSTTVEVLDLAPIAAFTWLPDPQDEGSPIQFTDTSTTGPDAITNWLWDFDGLGTSTDPNPIFTFIDHGTYNVCLTVTDDDGTTSQICHTITVIDLAPIAAFTWLPDPQDEGSPIQFTDASTSFPDDIVGWSWDFAGIGTSTEKNTEFTFYDNAIFTVTLIATDDDGSPTPVSNDITVLNVAPDIISITGPIEPTQIGTPITITGIFEDPGTLDTHYYKIDWGDTSITESTGYIDILDSTISEQYIYTEAGVYTVTLYVEDDDGGSDTETYNYFIVIFDPEGGFVTGGGWINSPEGAYEPDETLTGKANFGFVSKYKKGQSTPTGNTEFHFKAGDLNFHSDDYEWLVIIIAGAKAMFKGTGTINGEGSYKFRLTAIDEKLTPSTDIDLFRIKIWEEDEYGNEIIIYDNNVFNDELDAEPETEIGGGNIVIHKK